MEKTIKQEIKHNQNVRASGIITSREFSEKLLQIALFEDYKGVELNLDMLDKDEVKDLVNLLQSAVEKPGKVGPSPYLWKHDMSDTDYENKLTEMVEVYRRLLESIRKLD